MIEKIKKDGTLQKDVPIVLNRVAELCPKIKEGKSALQIGCRSPNGFTQFSKVLTNWGYEEHWLIEAFKPNCDKLQGKIPAKKIICGDALQIDKLVDRNFDLIIGHHSIIEHSTKKQFKDTLPKIMNKCNIGFLGGAPHGEYKQSPMYGNKYEEHKSHWTAEELEELGLDVFLFGPTFKPGNREMLMVYLDKKKYING